MKKLLASTAIAGLGIVLSVAAFALDNAGTQVDISGNVPKTCHFGGDPVIDYTSGPGSYNGTLSATASTINVTDFVDSATANLKPGTHTIELDFPNVYCNTPFTLDAELQHGYLKNFTPKGPGQFLDQLHYEFEARIGNSGPSIAIESPDKTGTQTGAGYAYNGILNVDFTIKAGTAQNPTDVPLLAGDFTDTATITISTVP